MAEGDRQPARRPRPGLALAFALAALASSWNGLAAPIAVVVAVCAAMLATGGLRRRVPRPTRRVAAAALGVSLVALAVAVVVLLRTADAISFDLTGEPVVKGRTAAELDEVLSGAAERTRAERSRAAAELDRVPGGRADGGAPGPPAKRPDGGRATR